MFLLFLWHPEMGGVCSAYAVDNSMKQNEM